MNTNRRRALAALIAAGLLWGTTVPLSKLALQWLPPGWLAFVRFALASSILLAATPRRAVRAACTPLVLASGAAGYGGSVVVQNTGITKTSVTHAALLIGATPVLVAVIAALWHRTVARPVAWAGFALSLAGVGLITGGQGGGATVIGDGLVLLSLLLSSAFTVAQVRLLPGRDPVALTAVQFLGAALATLPFSVASEGLPPAPHHLGAILATVALVAAGTLLPFTLFAYGQTWVSAEVAGAFLNIEPLVGAVAGIILFGDPAGPVQVAGGAAIIAGIVLSSLPMLRVEHRGADQPRADQALADQPSADQPRVSQVRPAAGTVPPPRPGGLAGRARQQPGYQDLKHLAHGRGEVQPHSGQLRVGLVSRQHRGRRLRARPHRAGHQHRRTRQPEAVVLGELTHAGLDQPPQCGHVRHRRPLVCGGDQRRDIAFQNCRLGAEQVAQHGP
jgi:drug/metabolite transporter (DMT)-like permease